MLFLLNFLTGVTWYINAIRQNCLQDIVQPKPSSFPIPSQELFSILDDASEGTFLLGTTVSVQKCVFPGGAGKIGLEPKNIVACTSFLLEQILVIVSLHFKICSHIAHPPFLILIQCVRNPNSRGKEIVLLMEKQ